MAKLSKPVKPAAETAAAAVTQAQGSTFSQVIQQLIVTTKKKKGIFFLGLGAIIFLLIIQKKSQKYQQEDVIIKKDDKKANVKPKERGGVNRQYFQRLWELIKIVIPSVRTPEMRDLVLLTFALLARTYLSIYLATVKGKIVKGIIQFDLSQFLKGLSNLALCSMFSIIFLKITISYFLKNYNSPGSFINSSLSFLNKRLALNFKQRLTNHFMDKYLQNLIYYQITNLDQRIQNPDQRLTADIDKWSTSLSTLYSNISKPMLDIILFSRKLSDLVGWSGPMMVIGWYIFTGVVLRIVSPTMGKFIAVEQKLEGQYRACHSELVLHSEEVAFYRGNEWEKKRLNLAFHNLTNQQKFIMSKRLFLNCFDGVLVKYGSIAVGYIIIGLPVFGKRKEKYLASIGKNTSNITRDYVRNSSLLMDLAAAIGRLIISYKNIQTLAGYTSLIYEMKEVLTDLKNSRFERTKIEGDSKLHEKYSLANQGQIIESDKIKFTNVPIISPSGEPLVKSINFEIQPGMNCIIIGPNGCGKSSLFRILGQLWPCYGGTIERPKLVKLFYIPQRPYLPAGNLRDQIIYPHKKIDFLRTKQKDQHLFQILKDVNAEDLMERFKDLEAVQDWNDVLSGGQKQKIAMARLFYHKPTFAILDECTSSTTLEIETILYTKAKDLGITLFTISHRQSLFKFHNYLLKFDGEGNYEFKKLEGNENMSDFKIVQLQKKSSLENLD